MSSPTAPQPSDAEPLAPDPALGIVHPETGRRWRLGVMGGTFDPIHHGHLVAASEVAARFGLDEVVFVPTGVPWQKAGRSVSLAEDRYLMTVVATASNPRFSVSRVDVDRPGDTYTVDTLKDLRRLRGDEVDLFFITGADALAKILTWRGAEELFDLAHFIGVSRPGIPLAEHDIAHLPADKVTLLEVPAMAISSTDCRERVAEGLPIWYLVPDGIVQYIAKRGLYGTSRATSEPALDVIDTRLTPDELADLAAAENERIRKHRSRPAAAARPTRAPQQGAPTQEDHA